MRSRYTRETGARCGVAALEFALILPILATLLIGVFDMAKALILWQEVFNAAHAIPLSATSIAVQPNKSSALTVAQAQQAMSIIYAEMPWVRDGIEQGMRSVTLSSINFTAAGNNCAPSSSQNCMLANVVWSLAYTGNGQTAFTQVARPCGTLTQITPTATIPAGQTVLSTLRTAAVTAPDPILVADVHYRYTPFFLNFLTGPVDFWATGYWPVRSTDPDTTVPAYTTLTGGTSC
jgi:Flp pilus assembly protein TadG